MKEEDIRNMIHEELRINELKNQDTANKLLLIEGLMKQVLRKLAE